MPSNRAGTAVSDSIVQVIALSLLTRDDNNTT